MKKFKSKVDKSYVVVLIVSFMIAVLAVISKIPQPDLSSSVMFLLTEPSKSRFGLLIIMLAFTFVAYIFLRVGYKVTDKVVIIHNGIFSKVIKIEDIRKVTHTTNVMSAAALSRKRLVLHHKGGEVQISPKDQEGFLAAMNKPLSDSL